MTLEIKVLAWVRHKNVVGLNRFMGFQHFVNFHSSVTYLHTISTPFLYSIQQYVINFVSDLRQVDGFLRVLRFIICYLHFSTIMFLPGCMKSK
jgi:hypothetical protein